MRTNVHFHILGTAVQDLMTTTALRFATPEQPLSSAASKLDKVTGLAVVDEGNVVVGVISIRDINRLRKQVGSGRAARAAGAALRCCVAARPIIGVPSNKSCPACVRGSRHPP